MVWNLKIAKNFFKIKYKTAYKFNKKLNYK